MGRSAFEITAGDFTFAMVIAVSAFRRGLFDRGGLIRRLDLALPDNNPPAKIPPIPGWIVGVGR